MENYVYPLIVCEEEGKIVFFNAAAQEAFGESDLFGRPLPPAWMDSDRVLITTADAGEVPFRLIWEEILWDGNVAWYLAAVPAIGDKGAEAQEEASRLREELEKSQEIVLSENQQLKDRLEYAERQAQEWDELRSQLQQSKEMAAAEVDELKARLENSQENAGEVDALRERLEQSAEMAAVETEKRQTAESERDRLEAKLRDLHQRSLSKLEAARSALESERAERDQLSQRLSRLKQETDNLRQSLEEKSLEIEEVRSRSGEQFSGIQAELEERARELSARDEELSNKDRELSARDEELSSKNRELSARDEELSNKNRELVQLEQELSLIRQELEAKAQEVAQAEERADRYRREYEELDREMMAAQEKNALLQAKLQSSEARMERYQRLMDRDANEFSQGSDAEQENERLRTQIEDLQVELAATAAAARSNESASSNGAALEQLEQECQSLREGLQSKESRIRELEDALTAPGATNGGAHDSILQSRLVEANKLIDELRFHRELEYQEAQASLRALQDRYASVQVNGAEAVVEESNEEAAALEQKLSELEGELQDTRLNLARSQEELEVKAEIAQSVPLLREKIQTLEESLQQARQSSSSEVSPEIAARVQELEAEVQRARTEASPEELQLARRRISELEATLASQPHGVVADGELSEKNRQLEHELHKTREQLADLNQELRRTLEGDRETKKLAYADQLTGLPNLNLTGQYLQVCFERSGRGEGALALILIDLDHFRRVNDALGQKAGDALLKEVGGRLQRCVTEKDTAIARRGEDEFMVVAFMENARVDGEALHARVRGIAHNLLNELAKPFDVLDQRVQVTASLGVALYPGPAASRVELLEQSEHAMYKAKESGRARVSFYTEEMHNHRERRRYMENELKQALAQRQFGLVYQPIYEIASSKVVGVEALLRWSHPQRGVLEPREFLEVAEDTGIIVQIGEQVIQEALEVAKQKFMKRRFLTLNLSFRQLIDSGFSARFMKHLQVAGVPPHEVMVEISEKAAGIDPDRIKNTLAHLAHWGVGIALDDFGTGSSELTHLTDYTLRVVKIDGSLIARIPDDRAATKLCQAIAQMSNALEIPVLAEGVETREQLKQIAGMGCQYAQGLILGAPMNVSQLIQVL